MDRPLLANSKQVPPPKRRIVPVAVTHEDQHTVPGVNDFTQTLVVPPPPVTGSSKAISQSGPGRRVFVNIDNKIEVKWKDVLRQQGLDIASWRNQRDQKLGQLDAPSGGQGAGSKRDLTGMLARKAQELYEESDGDDEDEENDDEDDTGSEPAENDDADGAHSSGEQDEEDEDDDDDDDDEKEGNDTGGEVDLEKEDEQAAPKAKRKRQRFERYDDDFIDDSELENVKVAAQAKTKFSGFYVTQGAVETIEEAPKPRAKPKPRQPKAADAAAAGAGPGRKRKQPQQQDQAGGQPQQQAQQLQEAAAGDTVAAQKKKRQRSETPAAAAAAAAQEKSAASKKAKPSPSPAATDTAQPTATAAGPAVNTAPADAAVKSATAAATPARQAIPGTAKQAIAAALAAKAKKPPAGTKQPGTTEAGAAEAAGAGPEAETRPLQQQQQPAGKDKQQPAARQADMAAAAAALAAAAPVLPQPPAAAPLSQAPTEQELAAGTAVTATAVGSAAAATAAASGGAVAAAKAAALPADIVEHIETLQNEIAEHKPAPAGSSASMNKGVKNALEAVGLTFARLPGQVQQQHTAALLSVLAPLMAPYMKEKKLKKLVLDEPSEKVKALVNTRAALMAELQAVAPQASSSGKGAGEDFQAQLSTAAQDALLAAWKAADQFHDALPQLALGVCTKLGWTQGQGDPSKAVLELKPLISKIKKRQQKQKAAEKSSQAAATQQTPEPSPKAAAETAADAAGGGTPVPTPQKQGSAGLQPLALASINLAAPQPSASQKLSQQQPPERFSQIQAPSPRLSRCLDTAVAAGAERQWLADKYATLKSNGMHQVFRTLCVSGPAGCTIRDMVERSKEHGLSLTWDDSTTARRQLKSCLQTVTMASIAGTTEANAKAFALLCFPGVQKQPAKPPKTAGDASGGQQGTQAAQAAGE